MDKLSLQDYIKAIETIKILLDEVDDSTPLDSPKMIEFIKASEIAEAYEDKHYQLPEPTLLDAVQFYFEQRFKFAKGNTGDDHESAPVLFNDDDLIDIVNEFDDEEWECGSLTDEEYQDKINELTKRVENESFEFSYTAEELRKGNQRDVYADHNEKLMLERYFFRIFADKFLPKLAKSSPKGVKKQINEITKEKELFMDSHMAYKGFIGTIEYSKEDNVYFGKLLKIRDLVLYEADKKEYLRASFYEAVEHHIETD